MKNELQENYLKADETAIRVLTENNPVATSTKDTQRTVVVYSFHSTCKISGIEPFNWLNNVLSHILNQSIQQIKKPLPP